MNTCIVSGMEISSLDGNQFIELSEVFSQKTIPVTKDLKEVKLPTLQAEVGLLIGAHVPEAIKPLQVISRTIRSEEHIKLDNKWTTQRWKRYSGNKNSLQIKSQ